MSHAGPEGDKGDKGEPGPTRLPLGQARAIVGLVVIIFVLSAASLLLTSREITANNHKWCQTIVTLDNADQKALKAPVPQRPHGAYSFALIRDFHQLRGELGCG